MKINFEVSADIDDICDSIVNDLNDTSRVIERIANAWSESGWKNLANRLVTRTNESRQCSREDLQKLGEIILDAAREGDF